MEKVKGFNKTTMPCGYACAITIRKAQGSTLDKAALSFDHTYPPAEGYAYVGCSRVRSWEDVWLMGKVRTKNWRPVDGGPHVRHTRTLDSESSAEDDHEDYDGGEGGFTSRGGSNSEDEPEEGDVHPHFSDEEDCRFVCLSDPDASDTAGLDFLDH